MAPLEATFMDELLGYRTFQQAQDLAPLLQLITDEERRIHRRWERRLLLAEADEHAIAE